MSLDNWRMQNVNTLICKVYRTIKSVDSSVEFGISPQGNIGNNDGLYADVNRGVPVKALQITYVRKFTLALKILL